MFKTVHQLVDSSGICKTFQRVMSLKPGNDMAIDVARLEPMDAIGTDIFYHGADPYLLLVDEASGHKTCWKMKNSSTRSVVQELERWFSTAGVPVVIRRDNCPAFR